MEQSLIDCGIKTLSRNEFLKNYYQKYWNKVHSEMKNIEEDEVKVELLAYIKDGYVEEIEQRSQIELYNFTPMYEFVNLFEVLDMKPFLHLNYKTELEELILDEMKKNDPTPDELFYTISMKYAKSLRDVFKMTFYLNHLYNYYYWNIATSRMPECMIVLLKCALVKMYPIVRSIDMPFYLPSDLTDGINMITFDTTAPISLISNFSMFQPMRHLMTNKMALAFNYANSEIYYNSQKPCSIKSIEKNKTFTILEIFDLINYYSFTNDLKKLSNLLQKHKKHIKPFSEKDSIVLIYVTPEAFKIVEESMSDNKEFIKIFHMNICNKGIMEKL